MKKILVLCLTFLFSLCLFGCGKKQLDKEDLFQYIQKIDLNEFSELNYLEVNIKFIETKEEKAIYFHPSNLYIKTTSDDLINEELFREYSLDEGKVVYYYKRVNNGGTESVKLSIDAYKEYRENVFNSIFNEDLIPSSVDRIISGTTLVKGITNIPVSFYNEKGEVVEIKLNKVSTSSVAFSYRISEYKDEKRDIKFEYPYKFTYTDIPVFV